MRLRYECNKEYVRAQYYTYIEKNKEKIKAQQRFRWKYDIQYKLSKTLKGRLLEALKVQFFKKTYKAEFLLGCSIKECKQYIESQWLPGMSWNNHTAKGWHIDHIKPVDTFDLTDPEQQKICFHYTNLRPLWATENLSRPRDGSDIKNNPVQG